MQYLYNTLPEGEEKEETQKEDKQIDMTINKYIDYFAKWLGWKKS